MERMSDDGVASRRAREAEKELEEEVNYLLIENEKAAGRIIKLEAENAELKETLQICSSYNETLIQLNNNTRVLKGRWKQLAFKLLPAKSKELAEEEKIWETKEAVRYGITPPVGDSHSV